MAYTSDSMTNPPIEELLDRTKSKFQLVTLAARRAREINDYVNQLGGGIGGAIPPQVTTSARKPLSIAFEELAVDKITLIDAPELEAAEAAAAADAAAAAEAAAAAAESDDEG